jgi:hypothetical protein
VTALFLAMLLSQNYQAWPVGPRTSGMGGAATALGEGAGNTLYNPAGLAFATHDNVTLSGQVFGLEGVSLRGELGDTTSHTNVGLFVIPSSMSLETHGLDFGPLHLSERWGLAVSIVAPLSFTVKSTVANKDSTTTVYRDVYETILTIYNSLSYRFSDEIGIGVSIVAMYRAAATISIAERDGVDAYQSLTYLRAEHTLGHTLAFGAQWRPNNGLRVGFATRLPLQNVAGFGGEQGRVTRYDKVTGAFTLDAVDRSLDLKYELPFRFNFGVAYERPQRFALAADVSVFTAYTYLAARDVDTGETLATRRLRPVVNVALGAEVWLGKRPLRLGVFTDFSPAAAVSADGASQRIDRLGATIGTSFEREMFRSDVGLLFAIGRLQALGYDLANGSFAPVLAEGIQWRLMLTYATVLDY